MQFKDKKTSKGLDRRQFLKKAGLAMGAPLVWSKSGFGSEKRVNLNPKGYPVGPDELLRTVPRPIIPTRKDLIEMYDKCWVLGLQNLGQGNEENGYIDWFIDEGFDSRIFQWDTCFSLAWAKYAQGALPTIESLDNFYMKQHEDGAIGGVIRANGVDNQPTDSPSFTHNNLFSWSEWEHYLVTGDASRFERVIPILADYARWAMRHRRHDNGHFYWSGFGSGMDNSPRSKARSFYPPYGWVDYDANEALAAYYLVKMAEVTGNKQIQDEFGSFYREMKKIVNRDMWNEEDRIYWDTDKDGSHMKVKTIALFWPMWARLTEDKHTDGLAWHLNDPNSFNRPHRVPTTAADQEEYVKTGGYWKGSIWAPTNHMVVNGLMVNGRHELAREIARNHLDQMSVVFQNTETVWENYAPEYAIPGKPAKGDFVGWSADGPIAQLIENYIGILVDVPNQKIRWNLLTPEKIGLENLQFGDGKVKLVSEQRKHLTDPVTVSVDSEVSFTLELFDGANTHTRVIKPGSHKLELG